MKPLLIIGASLLFSFAGRAMVQDTVYWHAGIKLQWKDFQGNADTASKYAASTSAGIIWSYAYKAGVFSFSATAYFVKKKSWKRGNVTSRMLAHEQGHFDITEIFARKLEEKVTGMNHSRGYFESHISAVVVALLQEKDNWQKIYDRQTNYGTNDMAQQKWLEQINKELAALRQP